MRLWKLPVIFFSLGILLLLIGCVPPAESERTARAGLAISKGCYDADDDGYGRRGNSISACPGSSKVFDCDDTTSEIRPGALERCFNILDDNCDGSTNEGCSPYSCTDSDPANNPTVAGNITIISANGQSSSLMDSCQPWWLSQGFVNETSCRSETFSSYSEITTISGNNRILCPSGTTCYNGTGSGAYCRSASLCGNGILESGEICDDGNTIDGDGCTQCQCADSDGGIDQYEGGTVTTSAGAMNDYCDQKVAIDPSRSIFERYCGTDGTAQVIEKRCGDDIDPLYSNEFLASGQGCYLDDPSIPSCIIYG